MRLEIAGGLLEVPLHREFADPGMLLVCPCPHSPRLHFRPATYFVRLRSYVASFRAASTAAGISVMRVFWKATICHLAPFFATTIVGRVSTLFPSAVTTSPRVQTMATSGRSMRMLRD